MPVARALQALARACLAVVLGLLALGAGTGAAAGEIYRCTVDGKVNYSDHPCAGADSKSVDVTVSRGYAPVPPPEPAATAPAPVATVDPPPAGAQVPAPVDYEAADRKRQCKLLDRQLKNNESAARQGGSGPTMDWLREEKRRIKDEQEELGC